jgi:hypothetical protein
MPKIAGQNSYWKKIKDLVDYQQDYVEHVMNNIEEALAVKAKLLKSENLNLALGAANFYTQEFKALRREYKNAQPGDFKKTHFKTKKTPKQEKSKEGNGLISLTFNDEGTPEKAVKEA